MSRKSKWKRRDADKERGLIIIAMLKHREILLKKDSWLPFPTNSCVFSFGKDGKPLPIGALYKLWDECEKMTGICPNCGDKMYGYTFGGRRFTGGIMGVCVGCFNSSFLSIGGFASVRRVIGVYLKDTPYYIKCYKSSPTRGGKEPLTEALKEIGESEMPEEDWIGKREPPGWPVKIKSTGEEAKPKCSNCGGVMSAESTKIGHAVLIGEPKPLLTETAKRMAKKQPERVNELSRLEDNVISPVVSAIGGMSRDQLIVYSDDFLEIAREIDEEKYEQFLERRKRLKESKSWMFKKPAGKSEQEEMKKELTNSIGIKFKLIPAGEFMMGSKKWKRSKPVHKVKISKPFYIGVYPVTQREWAKVRGTIRSKFKDDRDPIERVSWKHCQKFIEKLNDMENTYKYRLPTEAEWEYACRAGSDAKYCFGDDKSDLGDYGWYFNSKGKTHPVGKKKPNAWGLYDVHGNVWEWCQDWYDSDYYENSPGTDPQGPSSGSYRVLRGGNWHGGADYCRSANRYFNPPDHSSRAIGLRLVREASG